MPYDNPLNREIANRLKKMLLLQINNTPMSYDVADGMVGYANKKLLDDSNIKQEETKLEELDEKLPESNELDGGSLGSIGGFARGTWRDTGEGKTKGAGKRNKKIKVIEEGKPRSSKEKMKETQDLLLKRQLEGGKRKKQVKNVPCSSDVGELNKEVGEGKKKRGRPNKMCGGTDLGEPHNMVKPDGTTGDGKPKRTIGGRKLTPVANMQSSSMAGQGKENEKRTDVVKRIMKERGVSMIKASSIVKSEGLYKGANKGK